MLTEPPIFTQVCVPSTLTKPSPYTAQGCRRGRASADVVGQRGSCRIFAVGTARRRRRGRQHGVMRSPGGWFASRLFIAGERPALADELDADRLAAAPDHFATSPRRASRENASRNLPGSALASSTVTLAPVEDKSCTTHGRAANALKRDPSGLVDGFAGSRFLAAADIQVLLSGFPTPLGFRNRCEAGEQLPAKARPAAGRAEAVKTRFPSACPAGKRHYTFAVAAPTTSTRSGAARRHRLHSKL